MFQLLKKLNRAIPDGYTLANIAKAIENPNNMINEFNRLIYRLNIELTYILFYHNWIYGDELTEKYSIMSCQEETNFEVQFSDSDPPPDFIYQTGKYKPDSRTIYKITKSYLSGPRCIPFTPTGRPVCPGNKDSLEFMTERKDEYIESAPHLIRALVDINGQCNKIDTDPIFPLTGLYANNYYHWIAEFLPKIRALRHYEDVSGNTCVIILPHNPKKWQVEWINIICASWREYIEWNKKPTRIRNLILTDHRHDTAKLGSNISQDDLLWVRNQVSSTMLPKQEQTNRIYVSRQGTNRHVSNFGEIREILAQHGFEVYQLEDIPVSKQLNLFYTADCIAGPHGAGLINSLFSHKKTTLIELLPNRDKIQPFDHYGHYFRMSELINIDYEYVLSDKQTSPEFYIDPVEFSSVLSNV